MASRPAASAAGGGRDNTRESLGSASAFGDDDGPTGSKSRPRGDDDDIGAGTAADTHGHATHGHTSQQQQQLQYHVRAGDRAVDAPWSPGSWELRSS
eukprot:3345999-Pyramimonas_sp.AAC.1